MIWKLIALIVSRHAIAMWLIRRAQRTPYFHLAGYMERYWLFNPYGGASQGEADDADDSARHRPVWPSLPSIRIHHILREDLAEHPHDHPWHARTIILKGWYVERQQLWNSRLYMRETRRAGDTAPIYHGCYHHIERVSPGGVWTLFMTWGYRGSWGFLVDGKKVPWREYWAAHQRHEGSETLQLIGKSAHSLNQVIGELRGGSHTPPRRIPPPPGHVEAVLLEPCPFCEGPPCVTVHTIGGGEAPVADDYGDDGLTARAFVFCHECGAEGPATEDEMFDRADYLALETTAVRAWQQRDARHRPLYDAGTAEGLNLHPRPRCGQP